MSANWMRRKHDYGKNQGRFKPGPESTGNRFCSCIQFWKKNAFVSSACGPVESLRVEIRD